MSYNKSDKKKNIGEMFLLRDGKQGVMRVIFGRTGIVLLLLTLQILLLFSVFRFIKDLVPYLLGTIVVFTVFMVVYVANSQHNSCVKLSWTILITLLPGFGGFLYIFIQADIGHRALKKRFEEIKEESDSEFDQQGSTIEELSTENKSLYNLSKYIESTGGFPIYKGSPTKYFPVGEAAFSEMISQLLKAEKFIFLEYFIIDEGHMWGTILKVLADKVKEGVEVRFMYDGTCEIARLPHNYSKKIEALGIKTKVFAPIRPFLSTHYNYRDHRKIMVIDGKVAFTGGMNLADEYINKIEVYGHWKDTTIMIKGKAVESFTIMFLRLWNVGRDEREYLGDEYGSKELVEKSTGYTIPFGDSPLDNDKVGQLVYMDIINRAKDYVYIMTPYLILDGEMMSALKFAARKGVDVRIIMPHIPDKKFIFAQSRSHYKELIAEGVKIYEYTPGFMHAKAFLSDDIRAVVGTINLDYRSLYHHFECAVYMEEVDSLNDIKKDFLQTIEVSQQVSLDDIKNYNIVMKIIGRLLKIIAPLM